MFSSGAMALAIEGQSVRMMTFSGKKVKDWHEVRLNPAWVRGGVVLRAEDVGRTISEAIEENKLPKSGVLAALPSTGSGAQVLTLPKVKKSQIDAIVDRELRRLSSGSSNEQDYTYTQMLPKKSGQQEVYALSVPKKNVLNLVEACRAAGIKMTAMELEPFVLARAVGCDNGVIVHAEVDSIEMVIVQHSFPASFRSVQASSGGTEEAAQLLFTELPRTIEYYNRAHPESPLEDDSPVFLSGALALDPEVVMGVVEVTGREAANIEPPVDCPAEFPLPQFMTHVGLMMRGS